jgi:hypothetical protein
MDKVNTTERLAQLRKLMKERNVDIYGVFLVKLLSELLLLISYLFQSYPLRMHMPRNTLRPATSGVLSSAASAALLGVPS